MDMPGERGPRTLVDMDAALPIPSAGSAWHVITAFLVFFLLLIVGLALLAGLRSRGYDPVAKVAGVFVATPTAANPTGS